MDLATQGTILCIDPTADLALLQTALRGVGSFRSASLPLDGDDIVAVITGPQVKVGQAEVRNLVNLRVVATSSVGYDHIDVGALNERGIVVCNTPDYCTEEVADHTLAAVLSLWRGLPMLNRSVKEGRWDHLAAGPLRRTVASRLGVVGFGRIGQRLVAKATRLDIAVAVYDPFVSPDAVSTSGATPIPLDELLSESDAVSVHAALAPDRGPIIGKHELDLMRPDAVLVNVARAPLVDLDALVASLCHGKLRAAFLDVWSEEPPRPDDPRLATPNLIMTPHAAWYSPQSEAALWTLTAQSVHEVLTGREPSSQIR